MSGLEKKMKDLLFWFNVIRTIDTEKYPYLSNEAVNVMSSLCSEIKEDLVGFKFV